MSPMYDPAVEYRRPTIPDYGNLTWDEPRATYRLESFRPEVVTYLPLSDDAVSALTSASIPLPFGPLSPGEIAEWQDRVRALRSDREALRESRRSRKTSRDLFDGTYPVQCRDLSSRDIRRSEVIGYRVETRPEVIRLNLGSGVVPSPNRNFPGTRGVPVGPETIVSVPVEWPVRVPIIRETGTGRIPRRTAQRWRAMIERQNSAVTWSECTALAVPSPVPSFVREWERRTADARRNAGRADRIFVASPLAVWSSQMRLMPSRQDIGAGRYGRKLERNSAWCKDLAEFEPRSGLLILDRSPEYKLDRKARPIPADDVTPWDIVTESDVRAIRAIARRVCRMRDIEFGTNLADNKWEDVAQDALIRFAYLLRKSAEWECVAMDMLRRPCLFRFERQIRPTIEDDDLEWSEELTDGSEEESETVDYYATRKTIRRWAVRHAVSRPEFVSRRPKVVGEREYVGTTSVLGEPESPDGKWQWGGSGHAEYVNTAYLHSTTGNPLSESTFWEAFGDVDSRPMLARILTVAAGNPGLTPAQILNRVSKETFSTDRPTGKQKALSMSRAREEFDEFARDLRTLRGDLFRFYYDDATE